MSKMLRKKLISAELMVASSLLLSPAFTLTNLPRSQQRYGSKREGAGWSIVRCAERNSAREIFHLSPGIPSSSIQRQSQINLLRAQEGVLLVSSALQPLQSIHHCPGLIRASRPIRAHHQRLVIAKVLVILSHVCVC